MFEHYLAEKILSHFGKRYGSRDDSRVHVHELLSPAPLLPQLRGDTKRDNMGYLFVGEAVELGLREMLSAEPAPRAVRAVVFRPDEVSDTVRTALSEAGVRIHRDPDDDVEFVEVDGATDLLVDDDPAGARLWEVKTTRARPGTWRPYMDKWVVQAKLYSSLYYEPVRLVILRINDSDLVVDTAVYFESPELIECIVRRWLRGELYPWAGCME